MTNVSLELDNGLKLVNIGSYPDDPVADKGGSVIFGKINDNFELTLTQNDNLAGNFLTWDSETRKLTPSIPTGRLLVGTSTSTQAVTYNSSEFQVNAGSFSIKQIDAAKVTGAINPSGLNLDSNRVMVGGLNNLGRQVLLNPSEFDVTNTQLNLKQLSYSKLVNVAVNPEVLNLPSKNVPVGDINGKGLAYKLGPDFTFDENSKTIGVLGSKNLVTLASISAANGAIGRVLTIAGTSNNLYLDWQTVTSGGGSGGGSVGTGAITPKSFNTINRFAALSRLRVSPDGEQLEWEDPNENVRAMRNYIRGLHRQQKKQNATAARTIAEQQNQSIPVYNYLIPLEQTVNVDFPVVTQATFGNGYIAGGLSNAGYNKDIQILNFNSETIRKVSTTLPVGSPVGAVGTGLIDAKSEANSASSPTSIYIWGATPGGTFWSMERHACLLGTTTAVSTAFTNKHHKGAVHQTYDKAYLVGGANGANLINYLTSISVLTYSNDAVAAFGVELASGDSTYQSAYVTEGLVRGWIFGGANGTTAYSNIRRVNLVTPNVTTISNTLSNHVVGSTAFDNELEAILVCGATGLLPGANGTPLPANDPRKDILSRFKFSTTTLTTIGNLLTGTTRANMTCCSSGINGYILGGTERVQQTSNYQTWNETIPIWSNRVNNIRVVPVAPPRPNIRYNG